MVAVNKYSLPLPEHRVSSSGRGAAASSKMPSPARILYDDSHTVPGKLLVREITFEVPLNHDNPESTRIRLFGRVVTHHDGGASLVSGEEKPWLSYLEGGPGFGNGHPKDSPLVKENLHQSYRILFLDYRGTGLSTAVSVSTIPGDSVNDKVAYLSHFRQDSIVKDLEAVRLCLTEKDRLKRWSIMGQSFGGFVSHTYLSFYPDGLREVFLTGGLAPVNVCPEEVYKATFKKVMERNVAYYRKFPEDIMTVHYIASHIQQQDESDEGGIQLPDGGYLTVPRFLTLGLAFGRHEGVHNTHALLTKMKLEIAQFGNLTRSTLATMEQDNPLDSNPIYAILHEAIYCYGPGVASDWAAFRVGSKLEPFYWLTDDYAGPVLPSANAPLAPLFFSGEMIFPFHFDTYPELMSLKEIAYKLAEKDDWPQLYDEEQLARNEVPVFAASYVDDMYVDFGLARGTAAKVRGVRVFETNAFFHNALRVKSGEVISALLKLRDDPIE